MARLDGADTAATSGMPASTAFWTISNDVRPLTNSSVPRSGSASRSSIAADDLVHGVVAADVLGTLEQRAVEVEEPGRVQAARLVEDGLGGAQAVRTATRRPRG